MSEDEKRQVGRPKNPLPPPEQSGAIPMELMGGMPQAEENVLLSNLRAMDEFGAQLQLSCKLLQYKDHLARQVDRLERQLADLRTKIDLEQRRLDSIVGARREAVAG